MKRASVVETIVGDARIVKGQGDATAAFSFYVAWFLFALLSRAYFMDSFHVLDSCWFTLAASVSFSITMAFCSFRHVSCQTFRLSRLSFFGAVAAAAISLILMAFIPSLPGFHAVVGCLVGLSLALALSVAHRVLGKGSRREGLVFFTCVFCGACIVFFLVSWLVDWNQLPVALLVVLGASVAFFVRDSGEARKGHKSEGLAPAPSSAATKGKSLLLSTLAVILAGFLLSFLLAMFPRTTHYAGMFVEAILGGTSAVAWGAVALGVFILMLVVLGVGKNDPSLLLLAFVLLVLFAGMCLTVPSMSVDNSLPFLLITPAALLFLVAALSVWGFLRDSHSGGAFSSDLARYALAGFGAVGAALFALFFIYTVDSVSIVKEYLAAGIPIVLTISLMLLFIILRKELVVAFYPRVTFDEPLDTSELGGRCRLLAEVYGLTPREREIASLFAEGRDAPYVEKTLMISKSTVKTHVTHLYQKVGVSSRQELVDVLHRDSGAC